MITALGHECLTAESAGSGLEMIAAGGFDVVVCDYRLGAETADVVIEGIHRNPPHPLPLVVIATGATTDAGVRSLCDRYDLRVVAKPYGSREISDILAAAA